MKKVTFPLFWKFVIAIVFIVFLFGTINVLTVKNSVTNSLETELEKKGLFMAKSLAEKSASLILFEDIPSLYMLIDDIRKIDSSINYIFVLDGNQNVLAHTFKRKIPHDLVKANYIKDDQSENTILIKQESEKEVLIRDIAVPVLHKSIGTIRLGLIENKIRKDITNTLSKLALMIFAFLCIGILSALLFSYIITSPIKYLSKIADTIDIKSLHEFDFNRIEYKRKFSLKLKSIITFSDEVDLLYKNFNDMLFRLETTHNELQNAQASLMHTERLASIGTLTAGLAHEINNPIAGLQTCIRRLQKKPENIVQNKAYLQMMAEAGNKIENVLQGLLNFSRKQEYTFKLTDIKKLIENTITLVSYEIEKYHITINKEYAQDIPIIKLSAGHIEQVLINLFINSIDSICERTKLNLKETYNGIIRVIIKTDSNYLTCIVEDNGVGISDDKLRKIFDPFYTTKEIGEGTGLGLYISYKIISAHNGEIFANSQNGKTKFIIKFPFDIK